jgi:DNA polymerase-3 subunit gamma/tau
MTNTLHYLPLIRKYRPNSFDKIRAQEVFAEILTKSITTDQIAQAYILTGMRGIGKTSFARIIAQTVSCTNQSLVGKTIVPCEKCQNCTQYANNSHPDITEMDAASHTGIDDVRSIIDDGDYKPLLGKYKIYIVDEVHMLSKGAFNALLKIIEEPPPHLIFIFATTEIQKVPSTIISRCQRFDLKRFTIEQLIDLLKFVSEKEGVHFDEDALKTIALKSEGSARDALSLLDQARMSIASSEKITAKTLSKITGAADINQVISIVTNVFTKKTKEAIEEINSIYYSSTDLYSLLEGILEAICLCCKFKMITDYPLAQYEPYKNQLIDITNKVSLTKLTLVWQLTFNCIRELKDVSLYLQNAEILVMKILCVLNIEEDSAPYSQDHLKSQENNTLFLALEHLYQNRHFELYYYLMNEVEVINYSEKVLTISKEGSKEQLNHKLTEALKFVNPLIKVLVEHTGRKPVSIKQRIVEQITSTDKWDTLKSLFNVEEISDVIFCKNTTREN